MQKLASIISYTQNKGVSQKTQQPYVANEIHVKWQECPPGAQPYDCEMVMTVMGEVETEKMDMLIMSGSTVSITFYIGVRSWKDRKFTDIHGYLPKDLMKAK